MSPLFLPAAFPTCGEFNFSLSAINSTEFIIKAELHLYLTEQAPVEESYVVGIGATLENGQVIKPDFMRELRITDREGYAVFRIEDMLKNLISLGKKESKGYLAGWAEKSSRGD